MRTIGVWAGALAMGLVYLFVFAFGIALPIFGINYYTISHIPGGLAWSSFFGLPIPFPAIILAVVLDVFALLAIAGWARGEFFD